MAYYKLDINKFFDKKYSKYNKNSGIGGMGFITSKQMIHVYNDEGLDKDTNTYHIGIGDHQDITEKVLMDIYREDIHSIDSRLYDLISIKYWNSELFKIIVFYFPKTITLDEYLYLKDLKEYYDYIFSQLSIKLSAYTFGDNVVEYDPRVKSISDLNPIIDYARDRLDINKTRNTKEKILEYTNY